MLILFSLLCVLVILIYLYLNKNKDYWRNRNVIQFDGALRHFMTGNRSLAELYKDIYDRYPDEKYIGLFVGTRPAVLLKDVDDINYVLQGDFQSFHSRGLLTNSNDILADTLLFMNDYRRWKLLRQKISPVFTQKKLKNMFYIMERCARDFVEYMEDNVNFRTKSFSAVYTYTTASVGASVFGIDTKSKNTMECPFMEMSWKVFEPNFLDNFKAILSNYSPTLFRWLKLTTFKKFEGFFIPVIKTVLESRRKTKETRYDFIDTCLELQQSGVLQDVTTGYKIVPTDEVLAAQAFFFFTAGADPSASAMNYTLLELSCNPAILQRVHKEVDQVFNDCKETLTYEDIDKFVYLEMVLNESMRKYPPVTILQRQCTKNTVLPSGLKIEEDTLTLTPVFAIQRDEKYYPKPELFDPERFAPENLSKHVKSIFMPFGGGNRICVGQRLARLQIKIGLASLLRRFTLREQNYQPLHFEPSLFSLRDPKVSYELIPRDSC